MQKSSPWKTSKWNARLIYTINKNNKSNNKNQARITKAFEKTLLSETILSIITKIFLLYTLNDIASFNFFKFCWFEHSINTLKFKVSASKDCCFCFLLLPNLLIVSSLYLTLHCNKCFLLLNWQRLKFLSENACFLYSTCIWKYITKFRYEERAFDYFDLLLVYIFSGKFYKLKA